MKIFFLFLQLSKFEKTGLETTVPIPSCRHLLFCRPSCRRRPSSWACRVVGGSCPLVPSPRRRPPAGTARGTHSVTRRQLDESVLGSRIVGSQGKPKGKKTTVFPQIKDLAYFNVDIELEILVLVCSTSSFIG